LLIIAVTNAANNLIIIYCSDWTLPL